MDITFLVLVKQNALLEDDFEIQNNTIDDKYFEYDINQFDEYALEEAITLKEESEHDIEVVAATLGPERADETLRMALAKGCDRAVRIWDKALNDTALLEPSVKAEIFSPIVQNEDPLLVFTGAQADDDLLSATGVSLAETVGYDWSAVVIDVREFLPDEKRIRVQRELEEGVEEKSQTQLPAVLTIQTGINEPRYTSLRGIRKAQKKPLDVHDLSDLDIQPDELQSPVQHVGLKRPESKTETEYLEGGADEQAQQLANVLEEHGIRS